MKGCSKRKLIKFLPFLFLLTALAGRAQTTPDWNPNLTPGGANSVLFKFTKQVWLNPSIILLKQRFEQETNVKLLLLPRFNDKDTSAKRIEKAFDAVLSFLVYKENTEGSIKFYFDPKNKTKPFSFGTSEEMWCKFSLLQKDTVEQLLNEPVKNSSNLDNFAALPFDSIISQTSRYCKKILLSKSGSCGANPENEFTLSKLNCVPARINFEKVEQSTLSTNGGVDEQKYPSLAQYYNSVIDLSDKSNYPIAWKAVAAGKNDLIRLKITKKEKDFNLSKLVFKNASGTETYNTGFDKSDSTIITLGISGKSSGSMLEVVANYTNASGQTYAIGAFNIFFYEPKQRKVILWDVNGTSADAGKIEAELNKIYGNVFIKWSVEQVPTNIQLPGSIKKHIHVKGSGLLSNYMPDMNPIIGYFKDNCSAYDSKKEDTYYIILGCTNDTTLLGYMPRARNTGFVFNKDPHTIAHELGHGAFGLKHIFSPEELGEGYRSQTNNLMDYSSEATAANTVQNTLYKHQWDLIHDPDFVGWFEGDDEEGQDISTSNIAQLKPLINVDQETYTFISPAGKPFTLPKTIKNVVFYWNDNTMLTASEFFSDGALRGFTTADGTVYKAFFNTGTTNFAGYGTSESAPMYKDDKSKTNTTSKVIIATPCIVNGELIFKARKTSYSGAAITADHTGSGNYLTTLPVNYNFDFTEKVIELKDIYNSTPLSEMAKNFLKANTDLCKSDYVPQVITVANLINKYPDIFKDCFPLSWVNIRFANPACTTCVEAPAYTKRVNYFSERVKAMVNAASNGPGFTLFTQLSLSDPDELRKVLHDASYCDYTFLDTPQRLAIIKTLARSSISEEEEDYILSILSSLPDDPSAINDFLNGLVDASNYVDEESLLYHLFDGIDDIGNDGYKKLVTRISNLVGRSTLAGNELPEYGDPSGIIYKGAPPFYDSRLFIWDHCYDDLKPRSNVFSCTTWEPGVTRYKTIKMLPDGSIQIEALYKTINPSWDQNGNIYHDITPKNDNLKPYQLISFIDNTHIADINEFSGADGHSVVVPACFLEYAKDKEFQSDVIKNVTIAADLISLAVGVGEIELAYKAFQAAYRVNKVVRAARLTAAVLQTGNAAANLLLNVTEVEDPEFRGFVDRYNMLTVALSVPSILKGATRLPSGVVNYAGQAYNNLAYLLVSKAIPLTTGGTQRALLTKLVVYNFKLNEANAIKTLKAQALLAESNYLANNYIKVNAPDIYEEARSTHNRYVLKDGYVLEKSAAFKHKPTSGVFVPVDVKPGTFLVGSYPTDLKYILDEFNYPKIQNVDFSFPVPSGQRLNLLNITEEAYNYWAANGGFFTKVNGPWIDAAVSQGHDIFVVSNMKTLYNSPGVLSGFGKEIHRLEWKHGYRYNPTTRMMVPPSQPGAAGLPTKTLKSEYTH